MLFLCDPKGNNGVQNGSESDEVQPFLIGTVTELMAPSNAMTERIKESQTLTWESLLEKVAFKVAGLSGRLCLNCQELGKDAFRFHRQKSESNS